MPTAFLGCSKFKVVVVVARRDCTGSRSSKFKGSMFMGLKLFMGLNGCAVLCLRRFYVVQCLRFNVVLTPVVIPYYSFVTLRTSSNGILRSVAISSADLPDATNAETAEEITEFNAAN